MRFFFPLDVSFLAVGVSFRTLHIWRPLVSPETMRASTAALMVGMNTPKSCAISVVHLPVPFWPAESLIKSIR